LHEARPRELGEIGLLPSTLLLGVGVLLVILALAHLVTLTTGVRLRAAGPSDRTTERCATSSASTAARSGCSGRNDASPVS
jgi:hypothetical protein